MLIQCVYSILFDTVHIRYLYYIYTNNICTRSYLSPGLDPEHVVRLYEGVFKGHAGVALQPLLLAEDDMQVSGSVGGSVNSSVTIKHSVVLALHTVL